MLVYNSDCFWMKRALFLARRSLLFNEIPIGAVLISENNCELGRGGNFVLCKKDPSSHAEINAIRHSASNISNVNLFNTILYVTLEPCLMCISASILSKIHRIVFGTYAFKRFKVDSYSKKVNKNITLLGGVLETESNNLLKEFFYKIRKS